MIPIVAIVGRPNVGKSTLFNRLAGRPLAIVHDAPGVTRDRHYADAHIHGRDVTLIDTGGFDPTTEDPMGQGIARHVKSAMAEADVIVCILDGAGPPTQPDLDAVQLLRQSGKPVIYAANKVDSPSRELESSELYRLGIDYLYPVSALHGRGTGELEAAIVAALPQVEDEAEALPVSGPRVALIGRPNAGKSSLFNYLSGSERSLVDDRPGTTRDPIDSVVRFRDKPYVMIDTAGIRRKSRIEHAVESASVIRSIRAISRAQVVVLMCDATAGIAEQDARLLGLCAERQRALVVGLNKGDLLSKAERDQAIDQARKRLGFARWVPVVPLSAKTGRGVSALMAAVDKTYAEFGRRISTGELNRFFEQVLLRRPPPTGGGRAPRIYYITQAQTEPPVFVAMSNAPANIQESYQRFVINQIREAFGFEGVPIVVRYRKRGQKAED